MIDHLKILWIPEKHGYVAVIMRGQLNEHTHIHINYTTQSAIDELAVVIRGRERLLSVLGQARVEYGDHQVLHVGKC